MPRSVRAEFVRTLVLNDFEANDQYEKKLDEQDWAGFSEFNRCLPDRITTVDVGRSIVERRLTGMYARVHFTPPYATWPIKENAFNDATDLTPRALIRQVDHHVRWCLDHDELVELDRLVDSQPPPRDPQITPPPAETSTAAFRLIDERFAALMAAADVGAALEPTTEDTALPPLLAAGLDAWMAKQQPTGKTYKRDPLPAKKPALHGRLIEVINEATENEAHWAFRAIASTSAVAVINRLRSAHTMSGLDASIPQRKLVVLRNREWPTGPRTAEVTAAFAAAGGVLCRLSEQDLKVFAALKDISVAPPAQFQEWLTARKPASNTALFGEVFGAPTASAPTEPQPPPPVEMPSVPAGPVIGLGATVGGHHPFRVNLESLRRHTVIFAGSGSGKTVLIRRLVEECALQGVSAIVLDPNNDLARLGDTWPQPPQGWAAGDAVRAREYLDSTDVVVWTPRVSSGNPLSFQPLPDFSPVRDSADEFDQAIRSAVEALAPRAGVSGVTRLAQQGKAVLTEAMQEYARGRRTGLRGFTEYLEDLPEGVSRMAKATKLAHDAAETLKAAMVTDPLFGGDGTAANPGVLLTAPSGKRARVSVISLVGLTSDEQRQSFVNQLQMALFAWIKRNPAG